MVHSIVLLLIFGGVVPCCISAAPSVRGNYTELFRRYSLEQRIAYRIGQVECLKSLQDNDAPLGLGSLHRGNYSRDVSRFALKQRISFLLGQVNCLKIHISLDQGSDTQVPAAVPTNRVYIDCKDAYDQGQTTDGVYTINPDNQTAFQVYCDMTNDGGGWTMLQRRFDGSVDFNQTWTICEHTFGNLTGEHWLGLINMHRLTASAPQELRIDLENFYRNKLYARYSNFTVGSTSTKYRLLVSGYSGTAGDGGRGLSYHSGSRFTTIDSDNDALHNRNCALINSSGPWWYKECYYVSLNGKYYHVSTSASGFIRWGAMAYSSLKKVSMKIRRK